MVADVETDRNRGIRHITTFATWIDGDYQDRFGELGFIKEYAEGMLK